MDSGADSQVVQSVPEWGPAAAPKRRRRWPWVVALLVMFSAFTAGGVVAGATVSYAEAQQGRFLPGTEIGGVDVSGLTHARAVAAVEKAAAEELGRPVVVRWRNRTWRTTPRRLGSTLNAEAVIAEVAGLQSGMRWQDWAEIRWLGRQADVAADVALAHDRAGVRRFVRGIVRDVDRRRVDARLDAVDGGIDIRPARVGLKAHQRSAFKRVMTGLRHGQTNAAWLSVDRNRPKVTEKAFRQVLLLDQSEHRLSLFLDGKRARTWVVATGTGEYPTPMGRYEVNLKRYLPTWVNPDPEGWGADLPESIPPGVGNPLGLRALNWSAPGAIRFHGTQAINSLGTSASHGCVRMSNTDVVELYDLVDVGAVIISQY